MPDRTFHAPIERAIQLICIDLDGTLVGSGGLVHPDNWVAAREARDAGIHLAICSGRPNFGLARDYATQMSATGWHSFQNGASVVRLADGTSRSTYLPPALVDTLKARALATGFVLELYSDDAFAVESNTERVRQHAALLGVPFVPRPFHTLDGDVVRAQWLLSHADAALILAEPHDGLEVSPSTSPVMPDTTFVGMTRAGVTKGTAVRAIAAEYGITMTSVMFVGDGGNDVSAMRAVGWPVAMANAEAGALASAHDVVGDVDSGGLAAALRMAIGR